MKKFIHFFTLTRTLCWNIVSFLPFLCVSEVEEKGEFDHLLYYTNFISAIIVNFYCPKLRAIYFHVSVIIDFTALMLSLF